MSTKITKVSMQEAIKQHLHERGMRLTNLTRISYERLQCRVQELNIDMDKFIKERNEQLKNEKQQRIENKKKSDEEYKEALRINEYIDNTKSILNHYWNDITNKIICLEQLIYSRIIKRDTIQQRVIYIDFYKKDIYGKLHTNFIEYQENHFKMGGSYSIKKKLIEYEKKLIEEQEENKKLSLKEYIKQVKENKEVEEVEEVEEVKEEREQTDNKKFLCACGSYCRKDNRQRHNRTLKHQNYLKSL